MKKSNVVEITSATPTTKTTKKLSDEQRFKKQVAKRNENGCELYLGGCTPGGYGMFSASGEQIYAHRYAYQMHNKALISPGLYVLHSCDVKTGTSKKHLRLGTAADNARDKQERGRSTKGRSCNRVPFTDADIKRIIDLFASGTSQYRVSALMGRAQSVIAQVRKRNVAAIEVKRIQLSFATALEALQRHLAPSVAAVEEITKRAA